MKKEKKQETTIKTASTQPEKVSADQVQNGYPVYESEEYTERMILGTTRELGWKQKT